MVMGGARVVNGGRWGRARGDGREGSGWGGRALLRLCVVSLVVCHR
jgi:hypothetical protein